MIWLIFSKDYWSALFKTINHTMWKKGSSHRSSQIKARGPKPASHWVWIAHELSMVFTFFNDQGEKIRRILLHELWKLYKIQIALSKFYWSTAVLMLLRLHIVCGCIWAPVVSWVSATETICPEKPFTVWYITEKVCQFQDSWINSDERWWWVGSV